MKKILFDLMVSQPVAGSKFHGGGEYTKTVFKKLCDEYLSNTELHVFYNSKQFIDQWILDYFSMENVVVHDVDTYDKVVSLIDELKPSTLFLGLMQGLDRIDPVAGMRIVAVYHGFRSLEAPTDITAPLYENRFKGKIKELVKNIFSKRYLERKYLEQKIRINKCDDIVGVSEHSGYAAQVFFPDFDRKHIHVFYSPEKYIADVTDIEKIQQERIILMLGGNRWVKNIYRGAVAIDELFENNQLENYKVYIVGGLPLAVKKLLKNNNRFIECGYLSADELEKMYKRCEIFFYPTLNEGFGYPPEEVMKYGKTCIVSGINSLIEIYQDSVYYCNPKDKNEMKCRLLQATEKKIDSNIIFNRYKLIRDRQAKDLESLCSLIIQGKE